MDSDSDSSQELEAWILRARAKDTEAMSSPAKEHDTGRYPTSAGYPPPVLYASQGTEHEQDNEGFSRVMGRRLRPDKTPHLLQSNTTEQKSPTSRLGNLSPDDRKLPPMEITVP